MPLIIIHNASFGRRRPRAAAMRDGLVRRPCATAAEALRANQGGKGMINSTAVQG